MSYDISILDEHGKVMQTPLPHGLTGGIYALGGTRNAWLNVTWNYSGHFYRLFGDKGIRSLYGRRAGDTIPDLRRAIDALKDDVSGSYWDATEGNARAALLDLLTLAEMLPDGKWDGD